MAPIDYSKFANIEDSDDEKPEASSQSSPAKPAVVEKPSCSCCGKESADLKRCTVCKKAWYCSQKCQREDWESHKRAYHGPQAKAKAAPERRPPEAKAAEERQRKREEEKVIDNDDEDIKWYKHREWKPTSEPKKEFAPTQLTGAAATAAVAAETAAKPAAGSAWNAAGTWEEKDVTELAKKTLKEKLASFADVDAAGGALSIEDVASVDGEASKPVIRGKMRHMFDLSFTIKFTFKWMDSSGQRQVSGSIEVSDFTDNVFAEGVEEKPAVKLSFGDARLLDEGRKQAVQAKIGASAWPPEAGSIMAQAAAKMKAWVKDYEGAA